jgi:hypothetical protein
VSYGALYVDEQCQSDWQKRCPDYSSTVRTIDNRAFASGPQNGISGDLRNSISVSRLFAIRRNVKRAQGDPCARTNQPKTLVNALSTASVIASMSSPVEIKAGLKQSVLFRPGNDRLVAPMMTPCAPQSATTA